MHRHVGFGRKPVVVVFVDVLVAVVVDVIVVVVELAAFVQLATVRNERKFGFVAWKPFGLENVWLSGRPSGQLPFPRVAPQQ